VSSGPTFVGGLVIPSAHLPELAAWLRPFLLAEKRNGRRPPARVAEILQAIESGASAERFLRSPVPLAEPPDQHRAANGTVSERPKRILTTHAAAERLGLSERWVRHLLNVETLSGRRVGRAWAVDESSVEALMSERCAGTWAGTTPTS